MKTKAILTKKRGFASLLVASVTKSTVPETALTQNPIQMTLKNASKGAIGSRRPTPSSRRSIATLGPTANDRPTV